MTIYICRKCDKHFNRKSSYDSHRLVRKSPCVPKEKCDINWKDKNECMIDVTDNNFILTEIVLKKYLNTITNLNCKGCNKKFTLRTNLRRHIIKLCGKTTPRSFLINELVKLDTDDIADSPSLPKKILNQLESLKNKQQNSNFICNFCKHVFTRKDNLVKHLGGHCKIKKVEQQEHDDRFKQLLKDMNEIKEKHKKMKKQNEKILNENKQLKKTINNRINNTAINSHNTNNNTNNIINSNNVINIVAFGKEKLEYSEDVIKQLLNQGYKAVEKTIEFTNLNKNKPQYHNVFIPNIRSPYATVYDGKNWKLEDLNTVLDQLYDDKRCYLEDKFDEFIESLNKTTIKKFKRFLNDDDDENENDATDNKIKKIIKKRIKLLLYNKRDIPMNSKKLNKNTFDTGNLIKDKQINELL
jgi:hypothetical protein